MICDMHMLVWFISMCSNSLRWLILVLQMGNVWFCCGIADGIRDGVRLCGSSENPLLQFRNS